MTPNASQPSHRVALISEGLPRGGSTTFLVNLAGELARRNVPVEVVSGDSLNPLAADFQARHVPVWHPGNTRLIFEDKLAAMLRHLAEFQPTVVVANLGALSFEILRYVPAGVFRVGIIHLVGAAQTDLVKHYLAHLDLLAVVSVHIREDLKSNPQFKNAPVKYLPLGIEICAESELPARELNAPVRILYVGRLDRGQKRVHLFPEILAQLAAQGMPFHWTIAGDGPERGFLESRMKPARPGQTVSITGPLAYDQIPPLLRQHDIFLLTSDHEGLPLSLLEAMGHGLVPVVSKLPSGIPEVVNDTNGLLIAIDDVAGYARAINHLHENRQELAAKSAAAYERVKMEFSAAAMADRWLGAFPSPTDRDRDWAKGANIRAPLAAQNKLHYAFPMRIMRRLALKLSVDKS